MEQQQITVENFNNLFSYCIHCVFDCKQKDDNYIVDNFVCMAKKQHFMQRNINDEQLFVCNVETCPAIKR